MPPRSDPFAKIRMRRGATRATRLASRSSSAGAGRRPALAGFAKLGRGALEHCLADILRGTGPEVGRLVQLATQLGPREAIARAGTLADVGALLRVLLEQGDFAGGGAGSNELRPELELVTD